MESTNKCELCGKPAFHTRFDVKRHKWICFDCGRTPAVSQAAPATFSLPCLKGCPVAQDVTISVPNSLYWRWVQLARQHSQEWFAFLLGGNYTVTDSYFPRQTVSSTHCEPLPGEIRPNTIGAIHSHHTMGAFFSSTDWSNMNGKIEIVIDAKGEYECSVLIPLDCGKLGRVKGKIVLSGLSDDLTALEAAIQKPQPLISHSYQGSFVSAEVNPWDWHDVRDGDVKLPQDHREVRESMTAYPQLSSGSPKSLRRAIKRAQRKQIAERAIVVP